jgi:hypothetical protein
MPRLPNAGHAVVDPRKITQYLLSSTHPVGGPKARFFRRFGFEASKPNVLAHALLEHAAANDAVVLQSPAFGTKFEIRGRLRSPDGRNPIVRAVWMIDRGKSSPQFVTAIPD